MNKVLGFVIKDKGAFIKGVGNLPQNISQSLCPGIEMEMTVSGVLCHWKGKCFLIPTANCTVIDLVSDRAQAEDTTPQTPANPRGRQFNKTTPKETEPPANEVTEKKKAS